MMISKTLQGILFALVVGGLVFLLSLIPYSFGEKWGYEAGQIDALNGKIHYRLERQDNNEFEWVECPDVCEYEEGE